MGTAVLPSTQGKPLYLLKLRRPLITDVVCDSGRSDIAGAAGYGDEDDGERDAVGDHAVDRVASAIIVEVPRDDLALRRPRRICLVSSTSSNIKFQAN